MNQPDPLDLIAIVGDDGSPLDLSEMEAIELQSLLDANGIRAFISGTDMMPNLPYRLQVSTADSVRASEVIAAARDAGAEGADEAERAGEGGPAPA